MNSAAKRVHTSTLTSSVFSGGGSRSSGIISNGNGVAVIWSPKPKPKITNNSTEANGPKSDFLPGQALLPGSSVDLFREREGAGGMRVGKDYQAKIPPFIAEKEKFLHLDVEKSLPVWCPTDKLPDADSNNYLAVASEKYKYNEEQALGLLYWHNYDIPRALTDLGNFQPTLEEWTAEDKVHFEQAIQMHGKKFGQFIQILPDKTISNIIRFYYNWKKNKNKSSAMERHSRKPVAEDNTSSTPSSSTTEGSTTTTTGNCSVKVISQRQPLLTSNLEMDDDITKKQNGNPSGKCGNCGVPCTEVHTKDNLCFTCFLYWKKTGDLRPLTGPLRRGDRQLLGLFRQKHDPPTGMYINHDDLTILASAPPQAENVIVQGLDKDIVDAKCSIQLMKQTVEILKRKLPKGRSVLEKKNSRLLELPATPRINARWTQEELSLAAQCVRRYGKDYAKIIEIIPTKTESHVKSFYVHYTRRYGLDDMLKEHQAETVSDDLRSTSTAQTQEKNVLRDTPANNI